MTAIPARSEWSLEENIIAERQKSSATNKQENIIATRQKSSATNKQEDIIAKRQNSSATNKQENIIATRQNSSGTNKEKNVTSNNTLIDLNKDDSKTYQKTKSKSIVPQCCLSMPAWIQGLILGMLTASLVLIAVIVLWLKLSTTESATMQTSTGLTTTLSSIIDSAYWSFDNTVAELYGVYNGQLINGATYNPVSTSLPYVGYGRALNFLGSSNQSFVVSTPFLDLTYKSFTIEAWIYSTIATGDRGIFAQCQCSTCANQCFFLIVRTNRLYVGFTLNDLSGSTTLATNTWYHVAFVYNYQTQQQILYVNGVQDTINSNAQPYQGKNGSIQIGSSEVYLATNFFTGYIDNLLVTTQAKSAAEILSDASVFAYYSFDLPNPNLDSGPNGLNGTSVYTITVTGRVNEAIRIIGLGSNFEVYGFYYVPYGVSNSRSFSISIWINPSTTTSSTIVQLFSTALSTFSCVNLLGIYAPTGSGGQIVVMSPNCGLPMLMGPFVTQNTWTHVSVTYSSTNGYTLYVNGILFGATGTTVYVQSGTFAYLYIGYTSSCNNANLNTAYQGSVDEVYVHSRELTQTDVIALANA